MLTKLDRLRCALTLLRSANVVKRAHHLQVVITDRCNLACAGCLKSDPHHRPTNSNMPLDRYAGLLRRLRPRLVTLIGEGDPLLHKQLVDFVATSSAKDARTLLSTNLSIGDESLFGALHDAGLNGMKVTLSHSSRRRYQEIKGRDLFEQVLERVALVESTRAARGREDFSLVLEFWIEKHNLHEVREHLECAHRLGIRSVQFLLWSPLEERRRSGLDTDQLEHLRSAQRFAHETGTETNLSLLDDWAHGNGTPQRTWPGVGRCALPWLRAYVGLDGRMGPCVDLVVKGKSDPTIPLGNAFEGDTPYAGTALSDVRRSFKCGEEPHAICEGCHRGRVPDLLSSLRTRSRNRPAVVGTRPTV